MSSIITQADLQKGLIPINAELFATSKGDVSKTGMHVPDLDLIDGKNIMPTIGGYTSFFGTDSKIGVVNGPDKVQRPITYRTYSGNTIVLAFARDGLYIKSLAGDGTANVVETTTEVTIDLQDYLYMGWTKVFSTIPTGVWENWTWAILKNKIYLYQKGMSVILQLDGDVYGKIVLQKLNPTYIIGTGQTSQVVITSQDVYSNTVANDTYKQFTYNVNGQALATFKIDLNEYMRIGSSAIKWEGMIADTGLFNVEIFDQSSSLWINDIILVLGVDFLALDSYQVVGNSPTSEIHTTVKEITSSSYPFTSFPGGFQFADTITNWYSTEDLIIPKDNNDRYIFNIQLATEFYFHFTYIPSFDITIEVEGVAETHTLTLDSWSHYQTDKFIKALSDCLLQFTNCTVVAVAPMTAPFPQYEQGTMSVYLMPHVSNYDYDTSDAAVVNDLPFLNVTITNNIVPGETFNFIGAGILANTVNGWMSADVAIPSLTSGMNYDEYYYIAIPDADDPYATTAYNSTAWHDKVLELKLDTYEVSITVALNESIGDAYNRLFAEMQAINPYFFALPATGEIAKDMVPGVDYTSDDIAIYYPPAKATQLYITAAEGYYDGIAWLPYIYSNLIIPSQPQSYINTFVPTPKAVHSVQHVIGDGHDVDFVGINIWGPYLEYGLLPGVSIDVKYDASETGFTLYGKKDGAIVIDDYAPVSETVDITESIPTYWTTPLEIIIPDFEVTNDYKIKLTYPHFNATDIVTVDLVQDGTTLWVGDAPTYQALELPKVEGIASGRNRLIAWTVENRIHSSSASNPVDFTPSKTTQANVVSVNSIRGNIVHIQGSDNGFVVYATGNVVIAKYTGEQFIYKYDAIKGSSGVIDPRHITGDLSQHFYWSNLGLFQVSPAESSIKQLAPELTDWINQYKFPIWLSLISNRFLQISLQYAPDTFSYRNQREKTAPSLVDYGVIATPYNPESIVSIPLLLFGRELYPTFKRTLIFDTLLNKWGSCDVEHKVIYSLNPINQQGFPVEKDYFLSNVNLHNELRGLAIVTPDNGHWLANDHPADSYCLFGKWRSHRRKDAKLVEIYSEFVNKPTDTVLQIERTLDNETIYDITQENNGALEVHNEHGVNLAGTWFNILVRGVNFHIKRLMARGYTYGR